MNKTSLTPEAFLSQHTREAIPLYREINLAYWQAAVTGDTSSYQKYAELELQLRKIYNRPQEFNILKKLDHADPVINRQLVLLRHAYLQNQGDPDLLEKIVRLSAQIEQAFSAHQPQFDGRAVTVNALNDLMKTEILLPKRQRIWKATQVVGETVAEDLIQLVKLRNRIGEEQGFENFHTLSLHTNELDVENINRLFQQLFEQTEPAFKSMKSDLDSRLAKSYNTQESMMPWHYHDPFFQETPAVFEFDLDHFYANCDIRRIASDYFRQIGLPVDDILNSSDLYEHAGKNPHAFCTDIDREGDVRILCNLKDNARWMETLLHELGHAVYDKQFDPALPWMLRQPAHIFVTEAVAMFFGRMSQDADWLQSHLHISDTDRRQFEAEFGEYIRMKQLIFSRWAMVMFYFERELYANPEQDLNALWWDLKAKYQHLTPPENRDKPDWAAKIHFTLAPCYYHNYLLGELLASQLRHVAHTLSRIGDYFILNIFQPGALAHWNELIQQSTGEPLNPDYFIKECS